MAHSTEYEIQTAFRTSRARSEHLARIALLKSVAAGKLITSSDLIREAIDRVIREYESQEDKATTQ